MAKIIKFKGKSNYTLTRQYCECGSVLEMWMDSENTAVGLCTRCHLGVGDEMVQVKDEEEDETLH